MALEQVPNTGRRNAGFWLAQQLRDNQFSFGEAEVAMRHCCLRVPGVNTRGQREPYGADEMPIVRGHDSSIWNRLHAIPITVVIQKKDQELALFHAYQHWAEECGERSMTEKSFAERLKDLGIEKHSDNAGAEYLGIGVKHETQGESTAEKQITYPDYK